jgi:hypothetical protein
VGCPPFLPAPANTLDGTSSCCRSVTQSQLFIPTIDAPKLREGEGT